MSSSAKPWMDSLITALAPAIWGSTYIVTTQLLPPDRPFTAALIRTLPAGLLLIMFNRVLPPKAMWGRLLILSALNIGAFQALLFIAAYRLPGGLAAVLGATQPLIIMGLVWMLDRCQPARLALWASLAGILGMAALLLAPGAKWDSIGMAAGLAGAICMALGTYLARQWKSQIPLLAFTGWQLLLGGLLLLPMALMLDAPLPTLNTMQILGYAYLSVFGALIAYVLWFRGIARLSPVAASSLGLLSPVTAVALGWILLGQHMTPLSLAGFATVLASVLAVQWSLLGKPNTSTLQPLPTKKSPA